MLQEAADDADHPDGLAQAGHARAQAADAAHDEVDLHPGGRGGVERLDDLPVLEGVHLGDDVPAPPRLLVLHLALDQLEEALAHVDRRHQQLLEPRLVDVAGQHVEELGHVLGDVLVGR